MASRSASIRPTPWRSSRALAVLAIALTTVLTSAPDRTPTAEAALANETYDPVSRVFGPITVIGDSVLQGSVIYSPTLADNLAVHGWGPIRVRAGVGYSTGAFQVTTEARASYWIKRWRNAGWDPANVMVNLGANDSGRCNRDLQCARDSIMHLVDEIGPGHRIWWPMITRHPAFQYQADTWNLALQQIADERADFFTWDWPAVMAAGWFPSPDNTHLSVSGYRTRSEMMAYELTADLAHGALTGGDAPLPTAVGTTSEMVPIGPVRVIDTRIDPPGHQPPDTTMVVDVSDFVPAGTTAVAVYVSATLVGGPGFLTAYECSTGRPDASSANHLADETRGAVAITPISPDGKFCLYTLADADLLVDLQAAFVPPDADGLRFDPLGTPVRLADTRNTGLAPIIEVAVPGDADAASISVTAIDSDDYGYLVAYPCTDAVPDVATVNYAPGEVISGTAFVPIGPEGTICVWSLRPVDLTIDLTGTFSTDAELVFQAATPTRVIDTRDGTGGWSPTHGQFQTINARVAPPDAKAVTGTLTIVAPMRPGFLRAWGCGPSNETANVTSLALGVLANSVTTAVGADGDLCVFARANTDTLFDVSGWWVVGG